MGPISTVQTGLSTRDKLEVTMCQQDSCCKGGVTGPPGRCTWPSLTSGHAPAAPLGCVWPAARAGAGRGPRALSGGCCSHMGITQMTEPTETRTPRWSPRGLEGWGRGAPKDSPAFDPYPCALWSSCWRRWHLGRPWGALEPRLTSPKPHHSGPELQTGRLRLRSLSVVWSQPEGGRARI